MKTKWPKIFGRQQKLLSKDYSNTGLPEEIRKISNKQLNLTLKEAVKRTSPKPAEERKL